MRAYLSTFHDFSEICSRLKVEFVLIENSLPGAELIIHNKISINFLCKAIARRALMYCSILYDIRKIASVGQDALETLVPVDFDYELESMSTENQIRTFYSILTAEPNTDVLSPSEKMFRSNASFYVHHMFRMFNWLSTSPLIWPEPGQLGCTENRPVCQISFGEERLYKIDQDLFEEESSFFHNNDKSMAYIVLYNSLRREHKKFWFHEDGEVFRKDPPAGQDTTTCSISSGMHIADSPFLDAPVPEGMAYHRDTMQTFKNPQYVEDLYTSHLSSGPRIPDDYLDEFCKYLAGLWEWITDSSEHYSRKRSRCSIMYCEMDRNGGEVNLNFVDVRPCAAKHNFYKIFIFFLIQTVRSVRDLRKFVVCHCYPENSAILSSWKFRSNPADKDMKNYWMLKDDMQNVTLEAWKLKDVVVSLADGSLVLDEGKLPTAEMLNSQEYVDVYYPGKDHEAAVRAMEWARAAHQEVPDDIFDWDDDREIRKRPYSDHEDSDRAKREKLRCDLGAPVPKGMKYHDDTQFAMGDPGDVEERYAENLDTGETIPDYYLGEYARYLEELWKWIQGKHDYNSFFSARCSILHFDMNHQHGDSQNEIQLDIVDVRPCAEGHGFYKVLIYVIIQAVKQADRVGTFKVMDCLPENSMILSRLGFQCDPGLPKTDMRDFWMNKEDMGGISFESWNMGKYLVSQVGQDVVFNAAALPTAQMLNSQVYVDTYAATKDHAAAVSAMRSAPKNSLAAMLSAQKNSLDAPVPAGMAYHEYTAEYFTSPGDMEDFYTHESGEDIPDDYVDELCDRLTELWDWVHSKRTSSILDEHCSVMRYTLRRTGDGVSLSLVHVRPCAAKHGFYKLFIYFIIQAVKTSQGVRKFTVLGCLPENAAILAGWNFTRDPSAMDEDKMKDYWMLKEDMGSVTLESWRMQRLIKSHSGRDLELNKSALPTAHQLNSQRYVDRFFADGDHEVARRDMEDHEAAVEDMFVREPARGDKKKRRKTMKSRSMLGAPVPQALVFDDKAVEDYGSPQELEKLFSVNMKNVIGPDYLRTFQSFLKEMEDWVQHCFNGTKDIDHQYKNNTDVVKFHMEYVDGKILIYDMSTRPCAAKHGFQKVVLYTLAKALMKQIKSKGILIKDVAPAVGALLSSRGFVKVQAGEMEDYELQPANYNQVNENSWKMQNLVRWGRGNVRIIAKNFPTADMLNSQAYVDTYFATGGDHAKAVEAMSKRKRDEVDPDATTDEDEAEPKRTKGSSDTFFEETIETYNELLDRGQLVRYSAKNPNMSFIPRVPDVYQQAIDNRNNFLQKIRSGHNHYSSDQRMEILLESHVKENTLRVGIPLSNILMSYVLSSVVKVPYIDFKCYHANSIWQIDICKLYGIKKVSSIVWLKNAITVQKLIVEWLKETQVSTLMDQIAQNSNAMPASMKDTIVWRRFLICGIHMTIPDDNEQLKGEGHEFLTFMQVVVRNDIAVLEYGILDNIPKRFYDSCLAYNFEHIDFILDAMEDYFKEENSKLVSRVRLVRLGHLHNRLDIGVLVTDNGQEFQYTCMTAARRATMYASFVIDLTEAIQMTNAIETATNDHEFRIYEELATPSPPISRSSSGGTEVLDPSTPQFQSPTEMYGPAQPGPAKPLPAQPGPAEPLPAEPEPSQPTPDRPAQDQPRWPSEPLEHTPVPAAVCASSELPDPKKRYRINLFSYMYYMRKMLAWIVKNQDLWPYWTQTEPTSDRPVCEILYYAPLTMASVSDILEAPGGTKFHVLDDKTTYITLFNNFTQRALKYYFNPGEGPVFRHGPGMATPKNADGCVVSSRALLAATLDAPIPAGRQYTPNEADVFTSVELAEQDFVDHTSSVDIPEDYLAVLAQEFGKLFTWMMTTPTPGSSKVYRWVTTPVMLVNIEMTANTLAIPVVQTRPCAEGHGFYKVLLFLLISMAKMKFARLEIKGCLQNNTNILTRWGFQGGFTPEEQALIAMNKLPKIPLKTMWLNRQLMDHVTVESWNMAKYLEETVSGPVIRANAFPLAAHLNSQAYVDKFQETRNHELAVAAMSTFAFPKPEDGEITRAQAALDRVPLKFLKGELSREQSLQVLRALHERLQTLEACEVEPRLSGYFERNGGPKTMILVFQQAVAMLGKTTARYSFKMVPEDLFYSIMMREKEGGAFTVNWNKWKQVIGVKCLDAHRIVYWGSVNDKKELRYNLTDSASQSEVKDLAKQLMLLMRKEIPEFKDAYSG
jgi:hypothetical protein